MIFTVIFTSAVSSFPMSRAASSSPAVRQLLLGAGLRPTSQRLALARLMFRRGPRHLTADELHGEAAAEGISVSLATVYNTLKQFTESGLLRQIAMDSGRTYFDTNTSEHHHFFVEEDAMLVDIPAIAIAAGDMPKLPEGMAVSQVDVIVRLRRKR